MKFSLKCIIYLKKDSNRKRETVFSEEMEIVDICPLSVP